MTTVPDELLAWLHDHLMPGIAELWLDEAHPVLDGATPAEHAASHGWGDVMDRVFNHGERHAAWIAAGRPTDWTP